MAFVAAAIGGSAAIGIGSSIYGGTQRSRGARNAAAAQQDGISRAMTTMQNGGRDALEQLDPFRQFGLNAGNTLQDMMYSPEQRASQMDAQRIQLQGEVERLKAQAPKWATYQILTGENASERRAAMFTQESQLAQQKIAEAEAKLGTFEKQAEMQQQRGSQARPAIEESQWYKFQSELLGRSQDRAMAARGLTGSGFEAEERRRGLIELGAGETERQFGRLKGLYDVGANMSSQGANILSGTAEGVARLQAQAGQAQAGGIMGAANARADMATGVANSVNSAIGTGLNVMQFQSLMAANQAGGGAGRFGPTPGGKDPVMGTGYGSYAPEGDIRYNTLSQRYGHGPR